MYKELLNSSPVDLANIVFVCGCFQAGKWQDLACTGYFTHSLGAVANSQNDCLIVFSREQIE